MPRAEVVRLYTCRQDLARTKASVSNAHLENTRQLVTTEPLALPARQAKTQGKARVPVLVGLLLYHCAWWLGCG